MHNRGIEKKWIGETTVELKYLAKFEARILSWLYVWRTDDTWIIHIKIVFKNSVQFKWKILSWLLDWPSLDKWMSDRKNVFLNFCQFNAYVSSWLYYRRTHEKSIIHRKIIFKYFGIIGRKGLELTIWSTNTREMNNSNKGPIQMCFALGSKLLESAI